MQVLKIYPEGFAANSYLLTEDGKTAVAIDPAQPRVAEEAAKRGLSVRYVLLTHGHFDHIAGCGALAAAGAEIGCREEELPLLFGAGNLASTMGGMRIAPFSVDFFVEDGQELSLCGMTFRVLATPGHTAGGACYIVENCLFSGDTLFEGGIGRTDLPTGNAEERRSSLHRLALLAGDYVVYPGHGEDTTLCYEKKLNGYLR